MGEKYIVEDEVVDGNWKYVLLKVIDFAGSSTWVLLTCVCPWKSYSNLVVQKDPCEVHTHGTLKVGREPSSTHISLTPTQHFLYVVLIINISVDVIS